MPTQTRSSLFSLLRQSIWCETKSYMNVPFCLERFGIVIFTPLMLSGRSVLLYANISSVKGDLLKIVMAMLIFVIMVIIVMTNCIAMCYV